MLRYLQTLLLSLFLAAFAGQASAMFIQPDWFDPTQPGVGTNRYSYSNNDPVNLRDPNGNFWDWGMSQEDADDHNSQSADRFQSEADRIRSSDHWYDRVQNFLGFDSRMERRAEHFRERIGVSLGDRIRMDVGDLAAESIVGLAPAARAAAGATAAAKVGGEIFSTWNAFQSGTSGMYATRQAAAQAWSAYKAANGIVTGTIRSQASKTKFLTELAASGKAPRWMNNWLAKGRVPPGHQVDHIKALSAGGADIPANMRLKDIVTHKTRHRYYRPWE